MVHTWQVMSASVAGAAHVAQGVAKQDAVAVVPTAATTSSPGPLAVAVADGHGHGRHFRSREGAHLAVGAACGVALAVADRVAAARHAPEVADLAARALVPQLVQTWRRAVIEDRGRRPITVAEAAQSDLGADEVDEDPYLAYGTTLLLVLVADRWVLCLQIGDGTIVAIDATGRTTLPVPPDPRLDGRHTTSLCQASAVESFRVAAIDVAADPLSAVLMATDGYGNAQIDEPWEPGVGRDLHRFLRELGTAWVASNLGDWVARCASSEGSGDDTTVALVVRDPTTGAPPVEGRSSRVGSPSP